MRFIRTIILSAVLFPLFAMAQTKVVGFEIGTSTLSQVKSDLVKKTKIQNTDINRYSGGTQFFTNGNGYGIDGLNSVLYIFDKSNKLAAVVLSMDKSRFDDIATTLGGKYKTLEKRRPFVGNMYAKYKTDGSTIVVDAPHMGFIMEVSYVRDDLFSQFQAQLAKESQAKTNREQQQF